MTSIDFSQISLKKNNFFLEGKGGIVSLGSEITIMTGSWPEGFDIHHLNLSHLCFLKVNDNQNRKQQLIYNNKFRKMMFNLCSPLIICWHITLKWSMIMFWLWVWGTNGKRIRTNKPITFTEENSIPTSLRELITQHEL